MCNNSSISKYEISAQAKITRKLFHNVECTFELLDLINSDVCDFKNFAAC